ncbi:MAG TPA: hypothetical protein VFA99_07730 [Acidobacteriaceae bacterium]|nr:hypothetical protein [Acidobacteriaceae bacterium]
MQGTGWPVAMDGAAWARTIVDVYMLWFTFLVLSNIIGVSWWFARAPETVVRSIMLTPVSWTMVIADLATAAMTFVVAATVKPWAPPNFEGLINGAGIANAIIAIAFAVVWFLGWSHWRHRERSAAGFRTETRPPAR